jgi:hypothetical protein
MKGYFPYNSASSYVSILRTSTPFYNRPAIAYALRKLLCLVNPIGTPLSGEDCRVLPFPTTFIIMTCSFFPQTQSEIGHDLSDSTQKRSYCMILHSSMPSAKRKLLSNSSSIGVMIFHLPSNKVFCCGRSECMY